MKRGNSVGHQTPQLETCRKLNVKKSDYMQRILRTKHRATLRKHVSDDQNHKQKTRSGTARHLGNMEFGARKVDRGSKFVISFRNPPSSRIGQQRCDGAAVVGAEDADAADGMQSESFRRLQHDAEQNFSLVDMNVLVMMLRCPVHEEVAVFNWSS